MTSIRKLTKNGKALILAYDPLDHVDHGFHDNKINAEKVLKLAADNEYTGVILQYKDAERYYRKYKGKVPLILKLNGKTKVSKGDLISLKDCSVSDAVRLGASAVGYTIFVGSLHEEDMYNEFVKIRKEAYRKDLPTILWMLPKGAGVRKDGGKKVLSYAAKKGLELGADVIKIRYRGSWISLRGIVKKAGITRVFVGADVMDERKLKRIAKTSVSGKAAGIVVGKNVWSSKDPKKISEKLKEILF